MASAVLSKGKTALIAAITVTIVAVLFAYPSIAKSTQRAGSMANLSVGDYAPNEPFTFANGTQSNVSAYRGHEIVLWFVATWCSGCAQGNEVLNSSYSVLDRKGVKVIELELYKDLGYSGENIESFVESFAPQAYSSNEIIPAYASYNMTLVYDRQGYLDIYYLISPDGKIIYINSPMATTLPDLMNEINKTSVI